MVMRRKERCPFFSALQTAPTFTYFLCSVFRQALRECSLHQNLLFVPLLSLTLFSLSDPLVTVSVGMRTCRHSAFCDGAALIVRATSTHSVSLHIIYLRHMLPGAGEDTSRHLQTSAAHRSSRLRWAGQATHLKRFPCALCRFTLYPGWLVGCLRLFPLLVALARSRLAARLPSISWWCAGRWSSCSSEVGTLVGWFWSTVQRKQRTSLLLSFWHFAIAGQL